MAYKMGVKTHLNSFPAEAIGGLHVGVTPLEMSVVYATLADGGWRTSPIAITKVVFPNGHVDASWGQPHRVKVLSNGVTAEETSDPARERAERHRGVLGDRLPDGREDGHDQRLVDAWLDGYTPEYSTVVWMGYPNKRVPMTDIHGEPQQGGRCRPRSGATTCQAWWARTASNSPSPRTARHQPSREIRDDRPGAAPGRQAKRDTGRIGEDGRSNHRQGRAHAGGVAPAAEIEPAAAATARRPNRKVRATERRLAPRQHRTKRGLNRGQARAVATAARRAARPRRADAGSLRIGKSDALGRGRLARDPDGT